MRLLGQQRKKLQEALIDAFPTKSSLEQLLSLELEKNLDAIAGGSNLQEIVFNLIKLAEAQGWVEDLIRGACESNSGNLLLIVIAEELLPNHSEPPSVPSYNIHPEQSTQPQKILILAAIPQGLRLDKEIREIEEAIKGAVKRDLFEIKIRTAVRPQDIRRALAEERPQIAHFCGHGMEDGSLVLEDDGGNHKAVLPTGLAALFKLHTDYVKCVLLNACYSSKPAEAISKHINYVIGMNQPIEDRAAIVFAQGFYDGLGYDNVNNLDVIPRAFDEGIVAIQLENVVQSAIPSIWKLGIAQRKIELINQSNALSYTLSNAPKLKHQNTIGNHSEKAITKNIVQNKQPDLNAELNKEVTGRFNLKPSLQKYRFECAEVELKFSGIFGFVRKPIINSCRKGASYFVEDLGSGVELEMIAVPDGNFCMGSQEGRNASSSEFRQHQVSVNSFFIGKYPITQKQWKAVACLSQINRPLIVDCSKFKGDNYPVEYVCWYDAIEFCDRLSQYTGKPYRLPSESEWEYACRAGTTTLFHFGDIITSDLVNYKEEPTSSRGVLHHQTTPVDNFKFANAFGLYDMHGNIWEWCMDHWHDNYNKSPNDGTVWLNNKDSQHCVIRGGSWADIQDSCRSASRKRASMNERGNYLGFRVVCF